MAPTTKQISEIARATRKYCNPPFGSHITVWPDFTWEQGVDGNSAVMRRAHSGEMESRLLDISTPMSVSDIKGIIEAKLAERGAL